MNIFPTKKRKFKLNQDQEDTLHLLIRRTEKSANMTSNYTDKSFRGMIEGNKFKIISSEVVKGPFCVMTGEINAETGFVKVEINSVFRTLLGIVFCFPLIGMSILLTQSVPLQVVLIALITLFIRYVLIGLAFRFLSEESLGTLKDVLDLEWQKS